MSFDIYTRRKQLGLSLEEVGKRVGVSKSTVKKWESGYIENMKRDKIPLLAEVLKVSPLEIIGLGDAESASRGMPDNVIGVTGMIPVYGFIHAGAPMYAVEDILDYIPTTREHPEDYAALRIKGDSMINAGISDGSTVIFRRQDFADDGDIVACGINNCTEATVKRFKISGSTIILLPENPVYDPIILSKSDFDTGSARILGVAVEVVRKL